MRRILRFVLDLARELGDENAYQRYLAANKVAHSSKQWRCFFEQRSKAKFARARCC